MLQVHNQKVQSILTNFREGFEKRKASKEGGDTTLNETIDDENESTVNTADG
jgi:hypothetical protein